MPGETSFTEMLAGVRAGDQKAAAELVRRYEPEVLRAAQGPLRRLGLQGRVEPRDIAQAVLARFFTQAAAGRFDLREPRDLVKLLVTMTRNQALDEAKRDRADRRDPRRLDDDASASCLDVFPDRAGTPSKIVGGQEIVDVMLQRLSVEERYFVEQRSLGREWAELAAERGLSSEALRKRIERAVDRVSRQVGLPRAGEAR
jgi:RNA polymerase sigma factor (sigma-70 family)